MIYSEQTHFMAPDSAKGWKPRWGTWDKWCRRRSTNNVRKDAEMIIELLRFEAEQYNVANQREAEQLLFECELIAEWIKKFYAGEVQLPNKLQIYYQKEVGSKLYYVRERTTPVSPPPLAERMQTESPLANKAPSTKRPLIEAPF